MSKKVHLLALKEMHRQTPHEFHQTGDYFWHQNTGTRLGKGAFGEVFLGYNEPDSYQVAVKVVKEDFYKKEKKVYTNLKREIDIMQALVRCEFVVRMMQVEEQRGVGMLIVMELCDCDLEEYLKKNQITEPQFRRFLKQLSVGVKAMHDLSIVHRDLKPQNILLKFPGTDGLGRGQEQGGEWDIRLADFGYSRFYKEAKDGEANKRPVDMESLAGTPVFMAPEALYCVMYPGGSYDHSVDIWSVGALLYRVLVGKCGFFAPIQDILNILQKKGDAIAFSRQQRRTQYIRELPAEVDDTLTPVFKDKMTWLIKECLRVEPNLRISYAAFFQVVDDLVQTKIRLVSVHSGLESKVPYGDKQLTLSELQKVVAADLGVQAGNQIILRDNAQLDSTISQQQQLDAFCSFSQSQHFAGSGQDPKLFILDQSSLQLIEPPPVPALPYQDLDAFLADKEAIEEVRTRDNAGYLPQICTKLVKDIELMGESQGSGLTAYVQFALGARERHKAMRAKVNEDYAPFCAGLGALRQQLEAYARVLAPGASAREAEEFRRSARELEELKARLDAEVSEIDTEVFIRHKAIKSDIERAQIISVREIVRPLLSDSRGMRKLGVQEQLTRVGVLKVSVELKHQELTSKIHFRLNSTHTGLSQFAASQTALANLHKQIQETHAPKLQTLGAKLQETLLGILQSPANQNQLREEWQGEGGVDSPRLHAKLSELERERGQLLELKVQQEAELSQLRDQLGTQPADTPVLQQVLLSANAKVSECASWVEWLRGQLGVQAPNDETADLQLPTGWNDTNLETASRELCHSISRCPSQSLEQLKTELGRRLQSEENKDPMSARVSVAGFKKGDFVLFLPTKPLGPFKGVPKAFCIDNKQYFLDRACYPQFKLREDQSLATWLLGLATEDPVKEVARHVCEYPAGRTGTEFYTVKAQYHYAPTAKPAAS